MAGYSNKKKSCRSCCCCSLVLCGPDGCSINQKSSGIFGGKMQNTAMQTKITATDTSRRKCDPSNLEMTLIIV